jgi:DNA-binding response OmpR family regulator
VRVLLVGDYKPLLKALKQGLEEEGFTIGVADGLGEEDRASAADYDAVILDLLRPTRADPSLVQRWRRAGAKTHLVVLTPGRLDDRAHGLEQGADDCLVKPFELEELLARLRALGRGRSLRTDYRGVGGTATTPWVSIFSPGRLGLGAPEER